VPGTLRGWLNAMSLRPSAAGWLKPRLARVRIDAGRRILGARASRDGVILELDNGSRDFDHVLLATGYKVDTARLGILAPDLAGMIATDDGSPVLSHGYESSVRGLHFVGASAAKSYGPLLRFVWGAGYAAREVSELVRANSSVIRRSPVSDAFARRTETAPRLS
jgi:hypothetical protein